MVNLMDTLYEAYEIRAENDPHRMTKIDATRSELEIHKDIIRTIEELYD